MWAGRTSASCTPGVFFFNDTATTEIYTLSLHDALPIYMLWHLCLLCPINDKLERCIQLRIRLSLLSSKDRKSTRLNSSHAQYLVCRLLLEKKKTSPPAGFFFTLHISYVSRSLNSQVVHS